MSLTALGVFPVFSLTRFDAVNAVIAAQGLRLGYMLLFWSIDASGDDVPEPAFWAAEGQAQYGNWGPVNFFRYLCEPIWQRGAIPVVALTPLPLNAGANLEDFSNPAAARFDRIATHVVDPIAGWVKTAGAFNGRRLILQIFPEVNIWYDNGAEYIAAVTSIRAALNTAGLLPYVQVAYCANRSTDLILLTSFYPGAAVDRVDCDCFPNPPFEPPDTPVSTAVMITVNRIRAMAPGKPILVSQTGITSFAVSPYAAPSAATRYAWMQSLISTIQGDHTQISGFCDWDDYRDGFQFTTEAGDASAWANVVTGYDKRP